MFKLKLGMKALSLTQPMAWAIFHGKDVENRSWLTKFRGRIYIHASKGSDKEHYNFIALSGIAVLLDEPLPELDDFEHGAIIGEVDIIDCRYRHGDMNDNLFSPWAMVGQYGFILANPIEYELPIPCKGMLGFFQPQINISEEVKGVVNMGYTVKIVHLAKHVSRNGDISPLCATKPRRLDLYTETWSLDPNTVTCEKCKSKAK